MRVSSKLWTVCGVALMTSGCLFAADPVSMNNSSKNNQPNNRPNNQPNNLNNCSGARPDIALYCERQEGEPCGLIEEIPDGCGGVIQGSCGCALGLSCDPDTQRCTPDVLCQGVDPAQVCLEQGIQCGPLEYQDTCTGQSQRLDCGGCQRGVCEVGQCVDGPIVLKAQSPDFNARLGASVAAWGDWIAVGVSRYNLGPPGLRGGAVILFKRRSDGRWTQEDVILEVDEDGTPDPDAISGFGAAVALTKDWLIVGAPTKTLSADDAGADQDVSGGAVYMYQRSESGWTMRARLRSDAPTTDGFFGGSVAMDGDRLVVGEPGAGVLALFRWRTGKAHVFACKTAEPACDRLHTATAMGVGTFFGWSVALAGGRVFVGAPGTSSAGVEDAGMVFVLSEPRQSGRWTTATLEPTTPVRQGAFGFSLAAQGDRILVGAPGSPLVMLNNRPLGGVSSFKMASNGALSEEGSFQGTTRGGFGAALAWRGGQAWIGDPEAPQDGAVYTWDGLGSAPQLVMPPPQQSVKSMGASVAAGPDYVAVGVPEHSTSSPSSSGAVFVFPAP